MGVPKKRKSHSRIRMRRSHDALRPSYLASCARCGSARRPHTICGSCGHYKGKLVINKDTEFDDE
tara:strand:- start:437 stop:631 length:195 start_codon:yes stop_codon:yes gene_type:complete